MPLTFVIASVAKQSGAGLGRRGLLRCARNDGPGCTDVIPLRVSAYIGNCQRTRSVNVPATGLPPSSRAGVKRARRW
jgi:hypothetical protein